MLRASYIFLHKQMYKYSQFINRKIIVEVVTTSTKIPHLVFLVFSSAEAIDSK